MAQEFQTSFIPKKSTSASGRKKRVSMNLLMLIGVVLFLLAIAATIGVFVYDKILNSSLASKEEQLAKEEENFEPSTINKFIRLEGRIESAKTLTEEHVAMSKVLGLLEKHTLETVQFSSFSLDREQGDVNINLSGRANGFTSIALQSDELGKHPMLRDVLFSNFSLAETGDVTFSVSMSVDPSLVDYEPPSVLLPVSTDGDDLDESDGEEDFGDNDEVEPNDGDDTNDVTPPEEA